MSFSGQHHALTPRRERATLLTLGAVQFTHILDFMIMMPLGAQLMEVFKITPAQFSHLVAAYGFSAAVAGLAGGATPGAATVSLRTGGAPRSTKVVSPHFEQRNLPLLGASGFLGLSVNLVPQWLQVTTIVP